MGCAPRPATRRSSSDVTDPCLLTRRRVRLRSKPFQRREKGSDDSGSDDSDGGSDSDDSSRRRTSSSFTTRPTSNPVAIHPFPFFRNPFVPPSNRPLVTGGVAPAITTQQSTQPTPAAQETSAMDIPTMTSASAPITPSSVDVTAANQPIISSASVSSTSVPVFITESPSSSLDISTTLSNGPTPTPSTTSMEPNSTTTASPTSLQPNSTNPTPQESQRPKSNQLPIILGSVSGALGLFVLCLLSWLVYTRRRRRRRPKSSQVSWEHFYEWKDRYSSGSIIKVEELEEETLEEGNRPEPREGNHRQSISARFSSLRRSISRRSSRKPSPRRKSAASTEGIDNDTSAARASLVVAAPSAPLPLYHPPGIQNIPSPQEPSVPQYHHPHQPASPLFAYNTFDDLLRGVSHNTQAVPRHQDRQ